MFVKTFSFENYRNLVPDTVAPCEGINVICGKNAQGKTNLLECIWLFTGGRSFRGSKENELITFGKRQAKISLGFVTKIREQNIDITIQGGKRRPVLNDVPKSTISQIIGSFCAVVFSPDHLRLIKNGPEQRRNFIDGALCQIKPAYAVLLSRYKKILNERNALLKDIPKHRELEDTLEIWSERLAAEGALIAEERFSYLDKLTKTAASFYDGISSGQEKLTLQYKTACRIISGMNRKEMASEILKTLHSRQKDDIFCGYTTVGIHRDDLVVKINDKDARAFGSQGQQRSAVLSPKLAEAAVLGSEKGETPVILLDDVLSELDSTRQDYLLRKLDGMQVFITCCELSIDAANTFIVENGKIKTVGKT